MTAKKKSVAAQAKAKGIDPSLVYNRLSRGWTMDRALNTPVQVRNRPNKQKIQTVKEYVSKPSSNDSTFEQTKEDNKLLWGVFWGLLALCGILAIHSMSGM